MTSEQPPQKEKKEMTKKKQDQSAFSIHVPVTVDGGLGTSSCYGPGLEGQKRGSNRVKKEKEKQKGQALASVIRDT